MRAKTLAASDQAKSNTVGVNVNFENSAAIKPSAVKQLLVNGCYGKC